MRALSQSRPGRRHFGIGLAGPYIRAFFKQTLLDYAADLGPNLRHHKNGYPPGKFGFQRQILAAYLHIIDPDQGLLGLILLQETAAEYKLTPTRASKVMTMNENIFLCFIIFRIIALPKMQDSLLFFYTLCCFYSYHCYN